MLSDLLIIFDREQKKYYYQVYIQYQVYICINTPTLLLSKQVQREPMLIEKY